MVNPLVQIVVALAALVWLLLGIMVFIVVMVGGIPPCDKTSHVGSFLGTAYCETNGHG